MPDEIRLAGAFAVSLSLALLCTPRAIALARATAFYDHPFGYKGHGAPTPYLGGAAVVASFLGAALLLSGDLSRFAVLAACTIALWVVGTVDDRRKVAPGYRLSAEVAVAVLLWYSDLGWSISDSAIFDLLLTCVWVVGLVNAFNLMDNMDGTAGAVAVGSALGIAVVALDANDVALAVLGVALLGACLGFLRYNLTRPARIFLGDGGSMPIGLIVAVGIMALPADERAGWPGIVVGCLVAALVILDTALVVVSRTRRSIPLLTGGRDHLSHRLRARLGSARAVALTFGTVQILLAAAAAFVARMGPGAMPFVLGGYILVGVVAIAVLDSPRWAPGPATTAYVEQETALPDRHDKPEDRAPPQQTPDALTDGTARRP